MPRSSTWRRMARTAATGRRAGDAGQAGGPAALLHVLVAHLRKRAAFERGLQAAANAVLARHRVDRVVLHCLPLLRFIHLAPGPALLAGDDLLDREFNRGVDAVTGNPCLDAVHIPAFRNRD